MVPVADSVWIIEDPELPEAPETPDCTTVHENVVPAILLVNAIPVLFPEQMVCEAGVAVATGFGFTVIVTVIGEPAHVPAVGVIVYTAVPAAVDVAVRVWLILEPLPAEAPLTFIWTTVHEYVEPAIVLDKAIPVEFPEQIVCEAGVAVATGGGFTVIVTVIGFPTHPFAVGVTVYTAVPALEVVALSVCAILVPLPAEAPETFVCTTVQAKVVLPILLVNEIEGAVPEQMV